MAGGASVKAGHSNGYIKAGPRRCLFVSLSILSHPSCLSDGSLRLQNCGRTALLPRLLSGHAKGFSYQVSESRILLPFYKARVRLGAAIEVVGAPFSPSPGSIRVPSPTRRRHRLFRIRLPSGLPARHRSRQGRHREAGARFGAARAAVLHAGGVLFCAGGGHGGAPMRRERV